MVLGAHNFRLQINYLEVVDPKFGFIHVPLEPSIC